MGKNGKKWGKMASALAPDAADRNYAVDNAVCISQGMLQTSECGELLNPATVVSLITTERQPGKLPLRERQTF